MDLISHLLAHLQIESGIISRWTLAGDWGINVCDFSPGYCLHLTSGQCLLKSESSGVLELQQGQTLLALQGGQCELLARDGAASTALADLPWAGHQYREEIGLAAPAQASRLTVEGDGPTTSILGLAFTVSHSRSNPLLSQLPEFIVLDADNEGMLTIIEPALEFLASDDSPGYAAVASRLAELTVIGMLRAFLIRSASRPMSAPLGIHDPRVRKVLTAIYARPTRNWQLQEMAAIATMARSTFSRVFSALVGSSPIDYVHQCRIHIATRVLTETSRSIGRISEELGYHSERRFRDAFNRLMGCSPTQYRANHRGHVGRLL
ncbi:AraC family transcriptional regulator [Halioxenophilus sp. WMMB6]|uniref:AraC family transcriptional regulator n=1 Tax=Halioxenophilus sp. WMMB6 TaxID=3073815 RepID=UPI00295F5160|nr:AraC family transcriptional regulator [Halioxenophilus sp. WMMB6]